MNGQTGNKKPTAEERPEERLPEVIPAPERRGKKTRERVPLTCRTWAKVSAFLLAVVLTLTVIGAVMGALLMWSFEVYTTPEQKTRSEISRNIVETDAYAIIGILGDGDGRERAREYVQYKNIAHMEVSIQNEQTGDPWGWGFDNGDHQDGETFSMVWYRHEHNGENVLSTWKIGGSAVLLETIKVELTVAEHPVQPDEYRLADRLISLMYGLCDWIYIIGAAALIGAITCFVFLMCASGHHAGQERVQPGWGTRVPVDLLTAGVVLGIFCLAAFCAEASYFYSTWKRVAAYAAAVTVGIPVALGWCMSMAVRFKLGGWWKNSLVWCVLRLCWKVLRGIGRAVRAVCRETAELIRSIPLVWKTALLFVGISTAELFFLLVNLWEGDNLFCFWLVEKCILFPAVIFLALTMKKLQKAGAALAAGDLSYQVDTGRMFWDLKRHGENLNRISGGMAAAVEQRMRSERMKTELITNVSHDIKTPLTSIINYADLIGKEPCENERITEYAGVLHRQSERLKRLIDDLVEASKASTGNLEVVLAPCEAGVMLGQAAGEYEQRLKERGLESVVRQPEEPVKILADGRRLWRVFDNLMNNICKYAQSGTRVYLGLEKRGEWAEISFRNISREPLALSAEDFLERFVQGDASRSSDGNGLGLSIAKSLTELQNGTMELTVDGDLFKVLLRFPAI